MCVVRGPCVMCGEYRTEDGNGSLPVVVVSLALALVVGTLVMHLVGVLLLAFREIAVLALFGVPCSSDCPSAYEPS